MAFALIGSTSLISVGPLCDDNKLVVFDKNKVRAMDFIKELEDLLTKQKTLIHGVRNHTDGCWDITLPIGNAICKKTHLPWALLWFKNFGSS